MARLVYLRHGDTSKTMQTTTAGRLSIQRLADLLCLQANTVELNGVALDFDATGYTTQPLPQELGAAETNPIIVTGRPVPAASTSAGDSAVVAAVTGIAAKQDEFAAKQDELLSKMVAQQDELLQTVRRQKLGLLAPSTDSNKLVNSNDVTGLRQRHIKLFG